VSVVANLAISSKPITQGISSILLLTKARKSAMMQQLFFIRKQSYGFTGWCACCDLQGSSAPDGLALCHCCAAGLLMIGHQAAVPPARFKCTTVL
jgi:hypothetical protein